MKKGITFLTMVFLMVFASFAQTTGTVSDYDGNEYQTVKIGNQWWMAENLRTTHYADGTAIPLFSGTQTSSADDYKDYYTYPANNAENVQTYGLLYSWNVICDRTASTFKTLLPEGWEVADTTDWAELAAYVGGADVAGAKLKSVSQAWESPNTGATNEYGFNLMPAGDCNTNGFTVFGQEARFWTPNFTHPDGTGAGRVYMTVSSGSAALTKGQYRNVNATSIRLVKSALTSLNSLSDDEPVKLHNSCIADRIIVSGMKQESVLKLYGVNGALLKTADISGLDVFHWNVAELSSGIYVLAVGEGSRKYKIIKK